MLGDRRLHLDAEVLVVLLDVAQRLVGLDRALEEPGEDADLVVQLADAVERDVDVEVEVRTALAQVLHDRHRARRGAAVGRDADVPHAGVLVEDLDDLADVLAEEGLAAGRQEEHQAALADAGGDLVDLLERQLLLAVGHRRLFPSGMGAVGQEAVLALGVAGVGDEVDQVHGKLALLAEHLLPVLQVVEVAHRQCLLDRGPSTAGRTGRTAVRRPFPRRPRAARARAAAAPPAPAASPRSGGSPPGSRS